MPIHPLPQFEADLAEHLNEEADRVAYERMNAPKTIVVRFGYMKMVGEFPWKSDEKPGCGSKIVVRTHRGTEIGEMLTSTCANSGCSKSVSRKEMLEYIENSGGRNYPFSTDGRALRVATREDLDNQSKVEQSKHALRTEAKRLTAQSELPMKIVEVEPLLGGERTVVYFSSEDRIDFRDLVHDLQHSFDGRVDMRQVGARDEARITADYERCGQYCCCKNFLKVLKPISMRSAKTQKATLDPLKISGRCGRLMCCLRYEDETYDELRKKLPHRKSRVGTPDGDGIVVDTQILTQLAMVVLDSGTRVAVPIEELTEPGSPTAPEPAARPERRSERRPERASERRPAARPGRREQDAGTAEARPERKRVKSRRVGPKPAPDAPDATGNAPQQGTTPQTGDAPPKKKRRRRKKRSGDAPPIQGDGATASGSPAAGPGPSGATSGGTADGSSDSPPSGDAPQKKRRRRRRRQGGGGDGTGGPGSGPSGGTGPDASPPNAE